MHLFQKNRKRKKKTERKKQNRTERLEIEHLVSVRG